MTRPETDELRNLGFSKLFVRAGTFTSDGVHVSLAIPQKWASSGYGLETHLVFNFDSGVISHFRTYDLETMADEVRVRIEKQIDAANAAGVKVGGVQLDFDVPTRQLPRYASLVHAIRARSSIMRPGGSIQFSATGLVTWLRSRELVGLSRELDFIAPQFYEGETGRTIDRMTPISDLASFRENLHLADRLACPYVVGIPAYGHALLYDQNGKLQSNYPGLPPADALRHPSFRIVAAYASTANGTPARSRAESVGEEVLKLRAIRPDRSGRGLGYTLAYTIPTPDLLSRYLAEAKRLQSDRCLGVALFRYPEPGQSLALPMPAVRAVLTGHEAKPHLSIKVKGRLNRFDLIESPNRTGPLPSDVYLEVRNDGLAPTFVAPDAVRLRTTFERGAFDDVGRRDMDSVSQVGPGVLEFRKGFIAPGQTLRVGPIRLLSQAKKVKLEWKVRTPDGFETEAGEPVEKSLAP